MLDQVSKPPGAAGPSSVAPTSPLSYSDLVAHFQRGCKPVANRRIGLEHEKIGVVLTPDGRVLPLPYAAGPGEAQIRELLMGLQAHGWEPSSEGGVDGAVVALRRQRASVTLEPGGQFELSGAPQKTDVEAVAELDAHMQELLPLAEGTQVAFLGCGFRPLGTWADVPWVPKGRYAVMREYLPTRGALGVEMMKRTATAQANLDYATEADAIAKLRLSLRLGPLVTAMFAASPLRDGQPSGYKSFRAACWLDTDPDRCGALPFLFREGAGFSDYADWALDVPLFFVYRHKRYIPAGGMTFRAFMRDGFQGEAATLADWELHLSTLFPDTRLKQYIEVRTADAGPLWTVRSLASLWVGWLYSDAAQEAASALLQRVTADELLALRAAVPKQGLSAMLHGKPIQPLCVELVDIARQGLLQSGNSQGAALLDPLRAHVGQGRCPADDILDAFTSAAGDAQRFVRAIQLRL